jgi:phosphoribosylformimino-5-aminoimidazole carboxamide ribotide isomerase
MLIIPAIDLLDGKCVRLKQGLEKTCKIYSDKPVEIALRWQAAGSRFLHVVNLDGAYGRAKKNIQIISKIVEHLDIPVELGGGIRSRADAEKWLELGVSRVIFGTTAVTEPMIVQEVIEKYGPERVIVGIDTRQDKISIKGWVQQTDVDVFQFVSQMKAIGVQRLIHTDVSRDGENLGPNLGSTLTVALHAQIPIIASGGFSKMEHFQELADLGNPLVEGAIVGTALYENQLDLTMLINQFGLC